MARGDGNCQTSTQARSRIDAAHEEPAWLHVHWDYRSPGMMTGSGSYTTDSDEALRLAAEHLAQGASEVRISRTDACYVPIEYR